ncbi:hypothetical protein [Erysipelothrix anatis]|uniref:hypothetical protein n=1 Tax=Erysipelothrix anatis TaxID=2683713 RepID=UPI0013585E0E|nr:hypothetical protein [Erysipelothrix anatis]
MYLLVDVTTGKVIASGSIPHIEKETKISRTRLHWSYAMNEKIIDGQFKVLKSDGGNHVNEV